MHSRTATGIQARPPRLTVLDRTHASSLGDTSFRYSITMGLSSLLGTRNAMSLSGTNPSGSTSHLSSELLSQVTPDFRSDSQYGNVATLAAGRPNTPQRRGPIFSFPIPQTTLYRFQVSYCGVAGREAYTPAPELTGWPPIDPLTGWDRPSINPNPRMASTFCHAFSNAWM